MVPYFQKALRQLNNIVQTHRHDSPYLHIEPKYGVKQQYAEYDTSASPFLLMQPLQWTLPSHRLLPLHLLQPSSTINAPALAPAMITVPLLRPLPLDLASCVTIVAASANFTSAVVVKSSLLLSLSLPPTVAHHTKCVITNYTQNFNPPGF